MRQITRWVASAIICSSPIVLPAQQRPQDIRIAAPLDSQYVGDLTVIHDKLMALANAIPADKYTWRPSPQVRTVSEVFMHIAGEWLTLCPISVGGKPPADLGPLGEATRRLEAITAKDDVIAQLAKSWTYCQSVLLARKPTALVPDSLPAKMGFPRVVLLVLGDQHEHLGQLITYARSIGVVPPWSQ
jgi:uncharacterized damage-inducible protein DinB